MNRHVSLFTMGTTMWTAFLLAGLPSNYYLEWPRWAQLVLVVILPMLVLIAIVRLRTRKMTRRPALGVACLTAFYFTGPFFAYDWLYLGLHQDRGLSFLASHWYLTAFYILPWLVLPWLALACRDVGDLPEQGA
jgi:hypothetical protein